MTENEYIIAWLFYIFGAGVFFSIFWYWTRKFLWSEARQLIRIVLAVILFVPWYTDDTEQYLSPAWLVSIAEALLDGGQAFWRAGLPLVVTLVFTVFLSTLYSTTRWYLARNKSLPEQNSEA